ncbi:DUF2007 domain-containing protein [Planctomycetota bacterium]|nr:DUF2007 domain-containing protein [Planctomycetota bacterium]
MGENNPAEETVILIQLQTEIEAAMLVDALNEQGIQAVASGGISSGFRTEAPGYVNVLVHQKDIEQARIAAEEFNNEHFNIDWDNVDIDGDMPDEEA